MNRVEKGNPNVTRRSFLQASAAGAVSTLAFPNIVRARNSNERLDLAVIGSGGRGGHNMRMLASENIVALCDVDEVNLNKAAEQQPHARKYVDFRKLFDHANAFDAVVASTCEHTHAFATLPALQLGKHVYCEKPLTYNIEEARIIREAAAKAKVATQMGTQNHANPNYIQVVELIQSGAIGPVTEVHTWVSRAWGWHESLEAAKVNNDRFPTIIEAPTTKDPIPKGLHWDLWLGPAPERAFNTAYFPGPKWYRFWDFANGTMSDLGSHSVDLPFWALKLDFPRTVEAFGPPPHPVLAPASMHVVYEYAARGELPPVKLTWHQGTHKPKVWEEGKIPQWANGSLFIGEKGMILADYRHHMVMIDDGKSSFQRPEPFLPRPENHHMEWVHACKTGSPTGSNFHYAGLLTEANHLGNVAYRTGKKIHWDSPAMRATNVPEAERYIKREYRKGWKLA
jgi:predicted dehydrogenase